MSNHKQYYSQKWFKTDFEIFNNKYLNLNEKRITNLEIDIV